MGFRSAIVLLLIAALAVSSSAMDAPEGMVRIPAGSYRPLFRSEKEPKTIEVAAFYLDAKPVTNAEFLEFVRAKPQWQRSAVKRLFADKAYLQHWAGDLELPSPAIQSAQQPAVFVPWFAAKAYCAWKGKRLPSTV
ncbi:MAG: SUMF1/EgtB/PvdO family nonheme iron enzyme, partial [Chthoniobacteraceae bacterium]